MREELHAGQRCAFVSDTSLVQEATLCCNRASLKFVASSVNKTPTPSLCPVANMGIIAKTISPKRIPDPINHSSKDPTHQARVHRGEYGRCRYGCVPNWT